MFNGYGFKLWYGFCTVFVLWAAKMPLKVSHYSQQDTYRNCIPTKEQEKYLDAYNRNEIIKSFIKVS